jgi:hypothetical protein
MGFNDPKEEKIGAHDKNIVCNITKFQVINAHLLTFVDAVIQNSNGKIPFKQKRTHINKIKSRF